MRVIVKKDYEEASKAAAEIFIEQIKTKPDSVLGFATGSTPEKMYANLVKAYKNGEISFKNIISFNLDEYLGISPDNECGYSYYMNDNLFSKVDIKPENAHVPSGVAEDLEKYCEEYDKAIENAGGIDLQIIGVGENGHIAFNEPGEALYAGTHITGLTEETRVVNSRFFEKLEDVPSEAVSMGMGSILKAGKILFMATGSKKRQVMDRLLKDDSVSTDFPVSFLKLHRDVIIICDEEAYGN